MWHLCHTLGYFRNDNHADPINVRVDIGYLTDDEIKIMKLFYRKYAKELTHKKEYGYPDKAQLQEEIEKD